MTHRERVTRAIERTGPDRIPIYHCPFPGTLARHGRKLVDLLNGLSDDFAADGFSVPQPAQANAPKIEIYTDEWGSVWHRLRGYTAGEVREFPLASWDSFKDYAFPKLPSFERVEERMRRTGHRWYEFGYPYGLNLFEQMQFLRGIENLYMDLGEDRDEVHELADRLVDHYIAGIQRCLKNDADGYMFSDDWGSQNALLIHPDKWRSFFKPRYKKMIDVVKNGGRHVWFHSDGFIIDVLDDFVELGVDVLNPQHHIMDNAAVASHIGGKVCLLSDLDRQHILPEGTAGEIEEHVREVTRLFGNHNGGLILRGELGPEVPYENIQAMYGAFEKYRDYPLDGSDG